MRGIEIDRTESGHSESILIAAASGAAGFLLLIGLALCICCLCGRRKKLKQKEADSNAIALKTIAIEKGCESDDDEYSAEKNPNLVRVTTTDKYRAERTNRADYNSVETPLIKQQTKNDKPNNVRDFEKPLLKSSRKKNLDLKFVNNLKEKNDSGTEV